MHQKKQAGFTLIELVMVIVILGILAATALPKFVDLTGDAESAAISGVAGGLSSASAINYAGCAAVSNTVTTNKCSKVTKCSDVGTLMNPSMSLDITASDTSYYLADNTPVATTIANGSTIACTLKKATYSAAYTAIVAGQ